MSGVLLGCLMAQAAACAGCHEPAARAEREGVHASVAGCADCHGGDATAKDKDRAHGPALTRAGVPSMCARCHSDARRMNPHGLPTDQLAQYLTSRHGEALARGELKAAVCTDCHGAHGIRRARDPTSRTHPSNVPATCGRCHSDAGLMGKFGHSAHAESLYREGVHGVLMGKGDPAAPNCATCHGNHGAAPPGHADVGRVCGKCHTREREFFETSPHAFYARDGAFKECVSCHSNHRIVTQPSEIAGRCGPCHEPNDKELVKWVDLRGTLDLARSQFKRTSERMDALGRAGFHTDEEQMLLEKARTSLVQLAPLQHTLDLGKVRTAARAVTAGLDDVEGRLDDQERALRVRKLALAPILVFLTALGALIWAKRRRIARRRGGDA